MAQETYRADSFRWLWRNLKIVLLNGVLAAGFWLCYDYSHDPYFLVFSALFAVGAVAVLIAALFTKPKLVISDEELKYGKSGLKFTDVVDVRRHKDEYVFFLASRRRVVVKLAEFGDNDKKTIDKILAQRCIEHLAAEETKKKIAGTSSTDEFEFSYRAKRTPVFFTVYLLIFIFGGLSLFICVMLAAFGGFDNPDGVVITLVGTLAVIGMAFIIEKRLPKSVFTFRNDEFVLERNNKVKFSFHRRDVQGIGINPQGQPYILFRVNGFKKKLRLPLPQFSRKDAKEMKVKIRSIFFLPDQKTQVPVLKNPFRI